MRHSGERGMRNLNGRNASSKTPSTFARGNNKLVNSGVDPGQEPERDGRVQPGDHVDRRLARRDGRFLDGGARVGVVRRRTVVGGHRPLQGGWRRSRSTPRPVGTAWTHPPMPPLSTSPSVHGLPCFRIRASKWYFAGSLSTAQTPRSRTRDRRLDLRSAVPGRAGRRPSVVTSRSGRNCPQPVGGQVGLGPADLATAEEVPVDVVRLVDVRLDEDDAADGRLAAEQVEHDHPAGAGADLEDASHEWSGVRRQESGVEPFESLTPNPTDS